MYSLDRIEHGRHFTQIISRRDVREDPRLDLIEKRIYISIDIKAGGDISSPRQEFIEARIDKVLSFLWVSAFL